MPLSLSQLAQRIGAVVVGDGSIEVTACASIESAGPADLAFLANAKYVQHLQTTRAAAVIVGKNVTCPDGVTHLVADDPYFAFRNAMIELHGHRRHPPPMEPDAGAEVSKLAIIHSTSKIGNECLLHPYSVVEAGAAVGDRCVLYPGSYVGPHARLGDDCILYPNAVVYDRCVLGNRVTLHANTVVGHDGFGYATHRGAHHKIPQAGVVVIEDDVELGAGCAIERATMGETRIGKGTKFADLISIGHGTTIGAHCLFVSLVGVAGSVDVGDYVVLGGQAGVSGHLKIGKGVQAAGKSAIIQDVPDGMKVGGVPAIELDHAKRNALVAMDLVGLAQRVRQLERELAAVRKASGIEAPAAPSQRKRGVRPKAT